MKTPKSRLSSRASSLIRHLQQWQVWLITALLVGMPFHAFIVIVLGHWFGYQLIFAAWKEVLILVVIAITAGLVWTGQLRGLLRRPANQAILVALASGLVASVLAGKYDTAWLAGIKTTALPLVFFIAVQPLGGVLEKRLSWLILPPALLVALISIWQFLAKPFSWLASLGYNAATILPNQSVHPGFDHSRSFATLGGPNQLGAYLILPAVWMFIAILKSPRWSYRILSIIGWLILCVGLGLSFSRSAILGLGVGSIVAVLICLPQRWRLPTVGLVAVLGAGLYAWLRQVVYGPYSALNSFLVRGQFTPQGGIIGGDAGHIEAVSHGLRLVMMSPFGLGFGSDGPASFFSAHPLLTEDWWLQIALELGVIGLGALVVAFGDMARNWYRGRSKPELAMIASLVGLGVTSLFLHTFADSTLAIVWFGVAGILYSRREVVHG